MNALICPFLGLRQSSFAALRTGLLDGAEHFLHNPSVSVAMLRELFRLGPGMPFAFPSESAFAFSGFL